MKQRKVVSMNSIVQYYEKVYDEEQRLSDHCDNRHKVERIVKTSILEDLVKKHNVSNIADIGAGTGLYSIYFAKQGLDVSACDIVPKHVDMIKEKAHKNHLNVNAFVSDAFNVNLPSDTFDMVLLAGPIYHLHTEEEKLMALKEAKRIAKIGGVVVVDYLSDIHGYIQHMLLDSTFLNQEVDFSNIDDVFSYDNYEKMVAFSKKLDMECTNVFGTDGITRFLREDINAFNEDLLQKWIDFVKSISNKREVVDLSEHCLCVLKK